MLAMRIKEKANLALIQVYTIINLENLFKVNVTHDECFQPNNWMLYKDRYKFFIKRSSSLITYKYIEY